MLKVLTAEEMRAADAWAIAHGVPGTTLMENAGLAVSRAIESRWGRDRRVAIVCGLGNNGGDGFVIARTLKSDWTRVYVFGDPASLKGDAKHHYDRLRKERSRLAVETITDEAEWRAKEKEFARATLVVDALLGTGASGRPRDLAALAIEAMRAARGRGAKIVAVDLPSGVPADATAFDWPAVTADLTVTFAAKKPCHVIAPWCDTSGRVVVSPIGIAAEGLQFGDRGLRLLEVEAEDVRAAFPPRSENSHKGTFGHVLIVAGSIGKAGAAVLATRGAFRAGAGLVTVASVDEVCRVVHAAQPEAMTLPLGTSTELGGVPDAVSRLLEAMSTFDALVLGPGLGRAERTQEAVLDLAGRSGLPLVMDADALFALRANSLTRLAQRGAPTVLTPHPGEMSRILGIETNDVQTDRLVAARRASTSTRATVVLKGRHTIVASPWGDAWLNPTGSAALATAGTGDVLSGVIGALLGRGVEAHKAAFSGVFVHGLAGEKAGARRPWGVVAGDVAEALPRAIASVIR